MDHGSTEFSYTLKGIDFVKKSNKYKPAADKKRREKHFEEEDMMMLYLRRERISKEFQPGRYDLIGTRR